MKGLIPALALLMALLLTGCGNQSADKQTAPDRVQTPEQAEDELPEKQGASGSDGSYEADPDGSMTDDTQEHRTDNTPSEDSGTLAEDAADAVRDAADGAADGAKDVADGVLDGAKDVTDGIADGAKEVTDGIADGTKEVTESADTASAPER